MLTLTFPLQIDAPAAGDSIAYMELRFAGTTLDELPPDVCRALTALVTAPPCNPDIKITGRIDPAGDDAFDVVDVRVGGIAIKGMLDQGHIDQIVDAVEDVLAHEGIK